MESLGQKEQVWTDLWSDTSIEAEIAMWDYYGLRPYILKYTPRFGDVLEAGCGLGKFNFYLSHLGIRTIGLDFSKETIAFLRKWQSENNYNIPFVEGDIKHLPFKDNSLSGYLSFGVMEHFIEGPNEAMNEMYRSLRPGGIAIITTPNNSWNVIRGNIRRKIKNGVKRVIGKKVVTPPFFQYYYNAKKLKSLVEESGMLVTHSSGWAMLFTFSEFFGKKNLHKIINNPIYYKLSNYFDRTYFKKYASQSITISVKAAELMHCFICGEKNAGLDSLKDFDVPICNNCNTKAVSNYYHKSQKLENSSDYVFNPSKLSVQQKTCSYCSKPYQTDILFEDLGFNKSVCPACLKKTQINIVLSNENIKPIWRDRNKAESIHEK